MKQSRRTSVKFLLMTIVLSFECATTLIGQSRLHFDIDYHYNLGLAEKFMGMTLSRDKYDMGGHSLHLTFRYDVTSLWSVGLGFGLDRYTEMEYNTLPIFATVRYKMVKTMPTLYAFTDLGYAVKSGDFTKGFLGNLGIGYTYMFAKHFGLNFQIAYNLKCFTNIPVHFYNVDTGQSYYDDCTSTRHSLSFGIGLTFH